EPRELQFGTSGRRGEVVHLTQLEIYINALAEIRYLQSLPEAEGGIRAGDEFYLSRDLRPSSAGLAEAVVQALIDSEMRVVNLALIPTPALTHYAIARRRGSIMVTGSHIPFDRNGYKTNSGCGELLKHQEEPVGRAVYEVRERIYAQPFESASFDEYGKLRR